MHLRVPDFQILVFGKSSLYPTVGLGQLNQDSRKLRRGAESLGALMEYGSNVREKRVPLLH